MTIMRMLAALALAIIAGTGTVSAQAPETGFLNRSVQVNGTPYRFQVYVPREYQRSAQWPVILALHGGGQYGTDGVAQTDGGLARAIRRHPDRFPAVVVFPQAPPGTPGFQALGGQIALAALDLSVAEFNGDASRVYLTGLSMGGNGVWSLAYRGADRFAAMIVVCGFVGEFTGTTSGIFYPAVAPGPDVFAAVAQRVSKLPAWLFHGDADKTVSVEQSRRMTAALKTLGANVQYTEFPGVGHNAWDPAYEKADLIAWLLAQRKR